MSLDLPPEGVVPPLPVCQDAYQMFMELCRAHPGDPKLIHLYLSWKVLLEKAHERWHSQPTEI